MPANLLIFDAEYVSELTARMNIACDLMAEAVSSLKSASSHENWKCKERIKILDDFDELNLKLGRLDAGVNDTTRILGGSVSRFASLESQYESQAGGLSDELTNNYGFSGTVRTDGGNAEVNAPSEGQPAGSGGSGKGNASGAGAAGAGAGAAGAGGAASGGNKGRNNPGRAEPGTGKETGAGAEKGSGGAGGGNANMRIPGAGTLPGRNRNNTGTGQASESETGSGTGSGAGTGGGIMNVNLPVTHIPDNPGAAAKGTKDTQEIANAAVSSVLEAMTSTLKGRNFVGTSAENNAGLDAAANRLAEAYNAGRRIFESSAAIIASPSQPHTSERLTMAAGLVTLAGNSANTAGAGFTASKVGTGSGNFSQNAGQLLSSSALQSNSEASEFRNVLGAILNQNDEGFSVSGIIDLSGAGSSSSSGGEKLSFFDKILAELKKTFSGGQETSSVSSASSLASSSPIMDFLGKYVMDQAV